MDESYSQCIRQFADQQTVGNTGTSGGDVAAIAELLFSSLGNSFFSDRSMNIEEAAQYVAENHLDDSDLSQWNDQKDCVPILRLNEKQWPLVHTLELNMFYDDGEGFIDLGLDNVFKFDEQGGILGINDGTWLAANGQRAELILVFDNDTPYGFAAGVQTVYKGGETDTAAKNQSGLQPGDVLEFLCDCYSYNGDYQDSYLPGEPLTVTEEALTISNVPLNGPTRAACRITDLYNRPHWTQTVLSK